MGRPKVKRFILFSGYAYYPCGGWEDFVDSYATFEEAEAEAEKYTKENCFQWYHIVDLNSAEIVLPK